MTNILQNTGAVLVGLVVGSVINMCLVLLNVNYFYPLPEGVTFEDKDKFGEYIASLPRTAFLVVFCAHYGQSVVGGYVAARIGTRPLLLSHILGLLTLFGSVMNNLHMPVPLWTWIEIPFYPIFAQLIGKHVQESKKKQSAKKK